MLCNDYGSNAVFAGFVLSFEGLAREYSKDQAQCSLCSRLFQRMQGDGRKGKGNRLRIWRSVEKREEEQQ